MSRYRYSSWSKVSDCEIFKNRVNKFKEAKRAIKEYDTNCFDGEDSGHKQQINQLIDGAAICVNKYEECKQQLP